MRAAVLAGFVVWVLLGMRTTLSGQCVIDPKSKINVVSTKSSIPLPTPGAPEFLAGSITSGTFTLTVTPQTGGQRPWRLCVQTGSASFGNGKSPSDIEVRSNGGTWTPLSLSPQVLANGVGSGTVNVDVRWHLAWANDVPNAYSGTVQFVATF